MPTLKTFIIEDSPVILENLVATLSELAHVEVVGSVQSESEAVDWLSSPAAEGIDLIIVDIFLKSGTGLGFLQSARRRGMTARRVVLTNYATVDMRKRCASLGVERVFDKSRQIEELIAYCSNLAGAKSRAVPT